MGIGTKTEKEKAADTILEEVKKLDEFSRKEFYNKTKKVSDAGSWPEQWQLFPS